MPSDIGAEPSEAEVEALPSNGWRLIVAVAAALRYAPFMSAFAGDPKSAQLAEVRSGLVAACADLDSTEIEWDSLPWTDSLPDLDPDAWAGAGPEWLGFAHMYALAGAADYVTTRDPVHVSLTLGRTLEAAESWAEDDLDRNGHVPDRTRTAAGMVSKYSFAPVLREVGAQRLDMAIASYRQPGAASMILQRAETHGRWLLQTYDEWAGDAHPWRRH